MIRCLGDRWRDDFGCTAPGDDRHDFGRRRCVTMNGTAAASTRPFASTGGLEPASRLQPTSGLKSTARFQSDAAVTHVAFATACWLDQASIASTITAGTATGCELAICRCDRACRATTTIAPKCLDSGKRGPAFATALAVVITAGVTRIDAIRRMIDPGIDIQFAAPGAGVAAASATAGSATSGIASCTDWTVASTQRAATGTHRSNASG